MTNNWITCPLDIKEKIQQYLKYNMLCEFKQNCKVTNIKVYGYCTKCKQVLTFYDKFYLNDSGFSSVDWMGYIKRDSDLCSNCQDELTSCIFCNNVRIRKYLDVNSVCYNCQPLISF